MCPGRKGHFHTTLGPTPPTHLSLWGNQLFGHVIYDLLQSFFFENDLTYIRDNNNTLILPLEKEKGPNEKIEQKNYYYGKFKVGLIS